MTFKKRCKGIYKMLVDLERLAQNDGCIAAALALEVLVDKASGMLVDQAVNGAAYEAISLAYF